MSKPAIRGGTPVRDVIKRPWPSWPVFDESERTALLGVLDSGKWWYGEKVREFEQRFAAFQDAAYGVSCTNGTAALEMALTANGIGAGDEVIVPAYTFVATASAVLKVNAIPVFADIRYDSNNIDPRSVEEMITPRTRAIMPVHFAGLPCDMEALRRIADANSLLIIEDACHSWGTKWNGKGTGTLGACGAFSFQMSKNITAGEGGILLTDSEQIADRARSYSNCGRGKDTPWYEHYILGDNLRLTEFQAAILLAQLDRLEEQTLRREANAAVLDRGLDEIPGITHQPRPREVTRRSYHLYVLKMDEQVWGISRTRFLEALAAEGVPCNAGYPTPVYANPLFQRQGEGPAFCPVSCPYYGEKRSYREVRLEQAERVCAADVWLPHALLLADEKEMRDVVTALGKIWENRDALR